MTARLARNLEKIRLLSQELPADAADTWAGPYIREPDQVPGGRGSGKSGAFVAAQLAPEAVTCCPTSDLLGRIACRVRELLHQSQRFVAYVMLNALGINRRIAITDP